MNSIKAIIVDDEARARRVLSNLLGQIDIKLQIVAQCSNLLDAVAQIKDVKPDVIFLDVEMPKYSGFEIVNFFETIDFEVIFVTAYDSYAVRAFNMCAIDYLVKPIDRTRLKKSLERLTNILDKSNKIAQYELLLNSVRNETIEKIVIPESGNRKIIDLNEILSIEADGAYSKIHMLNGITHLVSKNLKYFEELLMASTHFYRCHRGWIINLKYVSGLNKSEYTLYLENDNIAKISRNNLAELSHILLRRQ